MNAGFLLALILAMAAPLASAHSPKILLFGDSLTQGLVRSLGWQNPFHPYELKFTELLKAKHAGAEVVQRGLSGERVTCNQPSPTDSGPSSVGLHQLTCMIERLPHLLHEAKHGGRPFDYVCILGGINDCGWRIPGDRIFHGLTQLFVQCKEAGAKVLAMTLMDSEGSLRVPQIQTDRTTVNSMLRKYAEHATSSGDFALLDLEEKIPYRNATEQQREEWWDDGLHLTPKGYDLMGEVVYEALDAFMARTSAHPA